MGPQDPKDVSRDIARDLSSVVRELAAVSGDAHHWLKGPEYAKRDAKIVVELHKHLESRLKGEALWKVYKLENRVRPGRGRHGALRCGRAPRQAAGDDRGGHGGGGEAEGGARRGVGHKPRLRQAAHRALRPRPCLTDHVVSHMYRAAITMAAL